MKQHIPPAPGRDGSPHARWIWRVAAVAVLVLIFVLSSRPYRGGRAKAGRSTNITKEVDAAAVVDAYRAALAARMIHRTSYTATNTAEQIVADKVAQFGRKRLELVRDISQRTQKQVPAAVEKFFEALEKGEWKEIDAQWHELAKRAGQYEFSTETWEELSPFWPAVLDAYGVAEQAHDWPAQQLLDYGNAILDSLRPGMVYVGGTDNGRWIPELLNETSGSEPHIIITQNALADGRYVEFMQSLYDGGMSTLTAQDSERAFGDYMADARKRFDHDQQSPDDPKQVRPGEDIRVMDGKVQVSGQVAVMSINERLLQTLMSKKPELSFAIQESSPLRGTYGDALPLGPLMELGARDGQNDFTPERATQTLDYWRAAAGRVFSDPTAAGSEEVLKSYSHDAVSAANLLAAHQFSAEAEQAYRLAAQLWPENPESVAGLAGILAQSGREEEARRMLAEFARQHPGQQKDLERISFQRSSQ